MTPSSSLNPDLSEAREFQTETSGIFFKARKILYDRNSAFQKIEVIENDEYGRVLLLDGLVQTTEKDEFYYHEMLVHPAMASHPHPQNVLIIGGGDGGALREVLKYPVKRAWLCEIDGQVVEACREFFPWLTPSFEDGRAELAIGDGNVFIRETGHRFDVIVVDSSDPVGPSTVLHQEEFYRRLRQCLNPGGIVAAQAGSLMFHQESHAAKNVFLKKLFSQAHFYIGPVPTYPGGMWCYNFLSDVIDPIAGKKSHIPSGLKYYNHDVHYAAFALPNFLKQKLD